MTKPALLILTPLLLASLVACKNNAASTDSSSGTAAASTAASTPSAAGVSAPASTPVAASVTTPGPIPSGYTLVPFLSSTPVRTFSREPSNILQDGVDYYALIDTNRGQILADLYEKQTPVTVNNFVVLARNHYFDGLLFHRVIDGFMAQTGDPKTLSAGDRAQWGTGGPGYQFPDEVRTNLTFDQPGELAMANSGPDTNGSQFFITFAPATFLNGKYNLFGKVVQGQSVLSSLTRTADTSGGQEAPIAGATPDKILEIRILSKGR